MNLRTRLALLIALTVTGALLAQGFLGYLSFRQTAQQTVRSDLQGYLTTLAHDRAEGEAPSYLPSEAGIRSRLIDASGKVIQEYGGPFPKTAAPDGDDQWLIQKIAVPDLGPGATLQASIPLRAYQQGLDAYFGTVTLSVALMSLVGVIAALLLSRGVLRPLGHLLRATERVAESGRLDERVAEPGHSGEIARLTRTFNAMLGRLSAYRQREAEFARHASHELRTPLAALQAQVEANQEGWITDAELIGTLGAQVQRLTTLTEALLLLSRENSAIQEPFDLAALCRKLAEEHHTEYHGPSTLTLMGSESLLTQAVTNLIGNAHRYAPGTPITVTLDASPQTVILSVSDQGPGVPAAALTRLTESFYRVPGTRAGGSGLGLAVVQRIAEAHSGTVRLSLVAPHGLKVDLSFPVRRPNAVSPVDALSS